MKKIFYYCILISIFSFLTIENLFAEIKLPAIFCDNMVLQQQTEAAIWGRATKNSLVKVKERFPISSFRTDEW